MTPLNLPGTPGFGSIRGSPCGPMSDSATFSRDMRGPPGGRDTFVQVDGAVRVVELGQPLGRPVERPDRPAVAVALEDVDAGPVLADEHRPLHGYPEQPAEQPAVDAAVRDHDDLGRVVGGEDRVERGAGPAAHLADRLAARQGGVGVDEEAGGGIEDLVGMGALEVAERELAQARVEPDL